MAFGNPEYCDIHHTHYWPDIGCSRCKSQAVDENSYGSKKRIYCDYCGTEIGIRPYDWEMNPSQSLYPKFEEWTISGRVERLCTRCCNHFRSNGLIKPWGNEKWISFVWTEYHRAPTVELVMEIAARHKKLGLARIDEMALERCAEIKSIAEAEEKANAEKRMLAQEFIAEQNRRFANALCVTCGADIGWWRRYIMQKHRCKLHDEA